MIYIILYYIIWFLKYVDCYGSHDNVTCAMSDTSCSHQIKSDAYCKVKFISNTDCPIYSVDKTYVPFEVPFILQTYKDKDLKTINLNLTFPDPKFNRITFHYKNEWFPKYHLCRSFYVSPIVGSLEKESVFWDCIIFHVSVVEGNLFRLEIIDDAGYGGTYSFMIPTADQQGADMAKYHTFFYIHQDYFHNTGRLIATLQASPFSVVAYNVTILGCVGDKQSCTEGKSIASYSIYHSEFVDSGPRKMKTIDLGYIDAPGRYAVSVQLISPDCQGNCAVSYSSIFEIPSNKVLKTIGILGILFFSTASICLAILLKLKNKHNKYVQEVFENPISLLFIYHPHTIEMYELLIKLKTFMRKECFAMPMLVDDTIGGQNPNQWTEQNMISAAKVIFFLPADHKAESATPIKKQYSYALNYFSGCNFPRKGDRFCYVKFPDSEKPCETLYGLRSFLFMDDLSAIISWIHDESFIHRILYWRKIAKCWSNYQFEDNPSMVSNYSEFANFNGILDDSTTDGLLPTELERKNYRSRIATEFDHDIPDVLTIT